MMGTLVKSNPTPPARSPGTLTAEAPRTVTFRDRPVLATRWSDIPDAVVLPAGSAWDTAERVALRRRDGARYERCRAWALTATALHTVEYTRLLAEGTDGCLRTAGVWKRSAASTVPVSGLARMRPPVETGGDDTAGAVLAEQSDDSLSVLPAPVRRLMGVNPEAVVHVRWHSGIEELRALSHPDGTVVTVTATRAHDDHGRVGPWTLVVYRATLASTLAELPAASKSSRLRSLLPGGGR